MSDASSTTEKSIAERIDGDAGLKAKGRLLTIISLLFIAIMLTGASIEEANTFVFKVIVTNQSGIPALLLLSILFLTIRYYSYARPFHSELEKVWTGRLLKNSFYLRADYHTGEPEGLIFNIQPDGFGLGDPSFGYQNNDHHNFDYHRGWFLCRYIDYYWYRDNYEGDTRISLFKTLSFSDYLYALKLEVKYRVESLVKDREYLDILGPYFIALLALVSFFFRSDMQHLVNSLISVSG